MPLRIGDEIGPYQITDHLGAGGMATVYQGYHKRLDRHVAIKIMHQSFMQDAGFRARFEREARIVARLEHPNIVPVYDFAEYDGQPYLVMKHIEGETLKDVLQTGSMSQAALLGLMPKIAAALTYAHKQGVLHRDVKPSNIIIDRSGEPYLTDFGLARITQAGESTMSADVMLGTPQYISPEQARGKDDLDARTDVYSLGIVLYELATGRVPFTGDTTYAIVHDHIYTAPPSPREINPDISPAVEQVLLKALAKDPAARYDTPTAMIDDYIRAQTGKAPAGTKGKSARASKPAALAAGSDDPTHDYGPADRRAGHRPGFTPPRPPRPPRPPKTPPPVPPLGRPLGEVMRELGELGRELGTGGREAREEFKKAIKEAAEEFKENTGSNRFSWRPGSTWAQGSDGKWGFFTQEELEAQRTPLTIEDQIRKRIEKRLEERDGLFIHMTAFVAVNIMLWMIFLSTGGGFPWPLIVTLGWGIGAVAHFISYYNDYGPGRAQRERRIKLEVERERQRLDSMIGRAIKLKHEELADDGGIRLTGDGEFTDSFIDEMRQRGQDDD